MPPADNSPITISNLQRALWTFLLFTLVAPFFAAVLVVLAVALARAFGVPLPAAAVPLGVVAVHAYVWSAIPAALAGVAMAALAARSAGFGWLPAAAAGVLAFAAAFVLMPFAHGSALPALAFLAGVVAIGVRMALLRGRIITH
jgi:hypothetical protein